MDLSVTAPFTRNTNSKVYTYNTITLLQTLVLTVDEHSEELIKNLDNITLKDFEKYFQNIKMYVIAKNMGKTGNEELRKKILNVKKRLGEELAKGKSTETSLLEKSLREGDLKEAIECLSVVNQSYYAKSELKDIDKFDELIELCGDRSRNFNIASQTSRQDRALKLEKQEIESITLDEDVDKLCQKLITCPVALTQDVAVILITGDEVVLKDLPSKIVNNVNDCPLNVLNYPVVVDRMKQKLDSVIGLKTLQEQNLRVSPMSGKKIVGGIILGDHIEFTKLTNFSIAAMFTSEKLMGNSLFYLFAIYKIISAMPKFSDITKILKDHLINKFSTTSTLYTRPSSTPHAGTYCTHFSLNSPLATTQCIFTWTTWCRCKKLWKWLAFQFKK